MYQSSYSAFAGTRLLASGDLATVVGQIKAIYDRQGAEAILLLEDATSERIDLDLNGSPELVLERALAQQRARQQLREWNLQPHTQGQTKTGAVPGTVNLLPRHWAWLNSQPGGASVALRKLVELASRDARGEDRLRRTQAAIDRFMLTLAGDLANYEEASRALYRSDWTRLRALIVDWPTDVRAHVEKLLQDVGE